MALAALLLGAPAYASDDAEVTFHYLPLAENERNSVYSRAYRQTAISEDKDGFKLGAHRHNYRMRFIRYGYLEKGEFIENVARSSQEQQEGDGEDWKEANQIWLPRAGLYRIGKDGMSVQFEELKSGKHAPVSLNAEEEAKVLEFFSKPSFSEAMGKFLNGRNFRIGLPVDPGPDLDKALGTKMLERSMVLDEVGTRWGRQVARFRISAVVQGRVPLEKNWTVDVDLETSRTHRAVLETKTIEPLHNIDDADQVTWYHLNWSRENMYGYVSQPLDRSNFQLVNPTFLHPGGAKVQDIAYLEENDTLAILEESNASGQEQQTIGTWNLNSQAVTKVMVSNAGSRIFASETNSTLLQTNDQLTMSAFKVSFDAFYPFGRYFRFPEEERFSAWDMLGTYGVVGTTAGRMAFINPGYDDELGFRDVSDEAIVGLDVQIADRRIASLDKKGRLRLHRFDYDEDCGGRSSLEIYCDGLAIRMGDLPFEADFVGEVCASETGETLQLIPGTKTVAAVLFQSGDTCHPQGEIKLLELDTNESKALQGQAFAVTKDGQKIVTAAGVYLIKTPESPFIRFDTPIKDAKKIVLAESNDVAFVLTKSGYVYMVDLQAGLVVEELVSQTDFFDPASVLARDIWQKKYFSLMSDGTLIVEQPETNRTTFVDLVSAAHLAEGGNLLDAALLLTDDRVVAAFAVADGEARILHLVAVNDANEATHITKFPVSDQSVQQLVSADTKSAYALSGEKLIIFGNSGLEERELDILLTFEETFGFKTLNSLSDQKIFFQQQMFHPEKDQFLPTIVQAEIEKWHVFRERFIAFPYRYGWAANASYPFAISRDARLAAVANLTPPENGIWNKNGRIIAVIDLQTGETHAEIFQGWGGPASLDFSPDGLTLAVGYETGTMSLFDLARGIRKTEFEAHQGRVKEVSWREDFLVTRGEDGITRIWDPSLNDLEPQFQNLRETRYGFGLWNFEFLLATVFDPIWDPNRKRFEGSVTMTSDGYYAGDKNRLRRIRFVEDGLRTVDLSEVDIRRNRPDIVFNRIDMISDERRDLLTRLHEKRLKEFGLTEGPALAIKGSIEGFDLELISPVVTQQPWVEFNFAFEVNLPLLDVLVRNNGIVLSKVGADRGERNVKIPLEPGVNRLQFVGVHETGGELILHRSTLRYAAPEDVLPPQLYLFAVGVSNYKDDQLDLEFAAKDARDLADYFSSLPNSVVEVATDTAATAGVIERAKTFFAQARPQDRTLFFFAGHGLLDPEYRYYLGSYETQTDDLERTALSFADLETVFDRTTSLHRAIFLDACHSGAVDPDLQVAGLNAFDEGAVVARAARGAMFLLDLDNKPVSLEDSYEALRASFLDSRSRSGANIISASGGLQFAFESDGVANGLFTHAILNGLRTRIADRNVDDRIELSELFQYVSDEVTRLSNGRQVPTVRSEPLYSKFSIN